MFFIATEVGEIDLKQYTKHSVANFHFTWLAILYLSISCQLSFFLDLAASFVCDADGWTGQPENGFWCYTNPGVEVQIGDETYR